VPFRSLVPAARQLQLLLEPPPFPSKPPSGLAFPLLAASRFAPASPVDWTVASGEPTLPES
jgi:hypothetical protein